MGLIEEFIIRFKNFSIGKNFYQIDNLVFKRDYYPISLTQHNCGVDFTYDTVDKFTIQELDEKPVSDYSGIEANFNTALSTFNKEMLDLSYYIAEYDKKLEEIEKE